MVFEDLLDTAIALTGADMGNCQLVDPRTGALRIVVSRGFEPAILDFFDNALCKGRASAWGVARDRARRIVVPDVTRSVIFPGPAKRILRAAGVRAVQSTPIFRSPGHVMGVVSTHWRSVTAPAEDQLNRLDLAISQVVSDIAREQDAIKVAGVASDLVARFGRGAARAAANRAQVNFDRSASAFWAEVKRALAARGERDR